MPPSGRIKFRIPPKIAAQQTENAQFLKVSIQFTPVISIIEIAKINIIAVIITSASIIPMIPEEAERSTESFLFSKISLIPEEIERQIFHERSDIIDGRKIAAITRTA